jgi:hypothetical protein
MVPGSKKFPSPKKELKKQSAGRNRYKQEIVGKKSNPAMVWAVSSLSRPSNTPRGWIVLPCGVIFKESNHE